MQDNLGSPTGPASKKGTIELTNHPESHKRHQKSAVQSQNSSRRILSSPIGRKYTTPIVQHNHAVWHSGNGVQDATENATGTLIIDDTIMALDIVENGTMGCAFFSSYESCLFVAQDVPLADEQTMGHFLAHIEPVSVFISSRFPDHLAEVLDEYSDRSYQGAAQSIQIITLQNSEFSITATRDRLTSICQNGQLERRTVFHPHSLDEYQTGTRPCSRSLHTEEPTAIQCLRFSANIGSKNSISTACAGVLIAKVDKRRAAQGRLDVSLAESSYEIRDVQEFSLSEYLYINATAMSSLQILHTETHPNTQTWNTGSTGGSKKEGLSLYGLFHCLASTSQGRTYLRKVFLRPTVHVPTIKARHQAIATLLLPQNTETVKQIIRALRSIPNIKGVISRLRNGIDLASTGSSCGGVWAALERFTSSAAKVQRLTDSLSGCSSTVLLSQFRDNVEVATITSVGSLVSETIDFEQSKSRERFSIRSGVDTNLDCLKRQYDGMESFLTGVVNTITENSASWARRYIKSCIFLPQLGFLLVIELDTMTGNGKYSGQGQKDDLWEKVFAADGTACYKTRQMRELDEAYGDVYCQIGDREVELLHQLASNVLEQSAKLETASDLCGELDALLALAVGASKYGWVEPKVGQSQRTNIVGGRHPLYETSTPHFIPNNFGGYGNVEGPEQQQLDGILVVTGPNHSGKSVYLKQVALIVYLAHIGSFVPAETADIGATDKILACIPAQESASENESAFATNLKQILHTVNQATDKSLVLVDEFGKGTCPVNGAGLVAGLIEHFLQLGINHCPRVLLATHFHEVFEFQLFNGCQYLHFAQMAVEVNNNMRDGNDPLTYLFTLRSGRSSSSFGEQCAEMNGVPDAVIKRAKAISSIINCNEDLAITCARLSYDEQAQLEVAEGIARQFISYDLGQWNPLEEMHDAIDLLEDLTAPDWKY